MCVSFRVRSKKNKKYCYCTKHKREIAFAECKTCKDKQPKIAKPIKVNKPLQHKVRAYKRFSIITDDLSRCYLCGSKNLIEKHEIVYGTANRRLSIEYGLVVGLCHKCHNEPPLGVHHNYLMDLKLKQMAERKFNEYYPNQNFIDIFGQSYLKREVTKWNNQVTMQ